MELRKARIEMETHRIQVQEMRQENKDRMETIQQLRSDKEAIEKYALEKGYGKKGEIIQQVPDEGSSNPSPEKKENR